MEKQAEPLIVGILGQWASGKSTAARILVEHLGGPEKVTFLIDLAPFAGLALSHVLEPGANVVTTIEEDGTRRLAGELATVWLPPGDDPSELDPTKLRFDMADHILPIWLYQAKVALGHQICERSTEGKPLVIEAAFGREPARNTIADLLGALEEAGVRISQVRWIIVEAGFERRTERNRLRAHGVPVDLFAQYAADGGDLTPEQQRALQQQGLAISRVANEHDDLARFQADLIAAFEALFADRLPPGGS